MISIASTFTSEMTVLGSRFIAVIYPLEKIEQVDSFLKEAESIYPKATHYCYAVHFDEYEYAYDNGEPSHSAGLPILNALKSENINRALLVVVRYFGGTKLGLPRLTKTYKDVSKLVAEKSEKVELVPGIRAKICTDYSTFEYLKRMAVRRGYEVNEPLFDAKVTFFLLGSDKILLPLLNDLKKDEVLEKETTMIKRRINDDSCK